MNSMLFALAQAAEEYPSSGGGGGLVAALGLGASLIFFLIVMLALPALCFWKLFEKAGEPGWASVVPIYNMMILAKIAGREAWWGILVILPCIGIIAFIMISIDIARKFGKDTIYAVGLILLGIIFYPMLGFGSAQYNRSA